MAGRNHSGGIVLDEGVLFRTSDTAFVQTKRKLLDDCDLWCVISLPAGVFSAPGPGSIGFTLVDSDRT